MAHLDLLLEIYKETKSTKKLFVNIKFNKQDCANDLIFRTIFLPLDSSTHRRLYHLINDTQEIPKCLYCECESKSIGSGGYNKTCNSKICLSKLNGDSTRASMQRKYGVDNYSQTQEWRDKIKLTSIERYGVEHHLQSKDIQNKIEATNLKLHGHKRLLSSSIHREKGKQTLIEKYGVDHIMKCDEGKKLADEACMKKYGFKKSSMHQSIKDKTKETSLERYGETSPLLNAEIKEKTKKTLIEKYGVIHNSQITSVHDSHTKYKKKNYILPSGKMILIQGYEDKALDILLKDYNEDDIVFSAKDMEDIFGKIQYDYDSKLKRYFPDFYIKSTNTIIEVKSKYTYNASLEVNLLKQQACLDKGLNFKFMIID